MKIQICEHGVFFNNKTVRAIKSACRFFADNTNMPEGVRLIVTVGSFRQRSTRALCEQITKKTYLISLSRGIATKIANFKFKGYQALFHELEHVRQFSRGELWYTRNLLQMKYLGERMDNVDYWEQPFEIQADEVGAEFARDFLTVVVRDILTELQGGK